MQYGDNGYKAIDTLQRMGDCFRGMFNGRYKIVNQDGNVYVTKRKFGSKEDMPLEEKDFVGKIGIDNNRLLRKLERNFRKGNSPKKVYFKFSKKGSTGIPFSMLEEETNMFERKQYRSVPVDQYKKRVEFAEKVSKYGFPILLGTAAALKFIGRADDIGPNVPEEIAKFRVMLDATGDITGLGSLILGGVVGPSSYVSDTNLERYRFIRKKMKGVQRHYI